MKHNILKKTVLILLSAASLLPESMQQQESLQNPESKYLYKKSTHHSDFFAKDRLIEESLFSPEMAWNILYYMRQDRMVINKITGAVENLPKIAAVLKSIAQDLNNSAQIVSEQKQAMKNALHALLEATETAIFVTAVEAAYHDPRFIFQPTVNEQLISELNAQKQTIQSYITAINNITPYDEQYSSSSYFSWLPSFGAAANPASALSMQQITIDPYSETITIPASLISTIVKTNDYKEMADAGQAANLLFKQCFIAQQHHLKDTQLISKIKFNINAPVNAHNYIYTRFPDIVQMCQIAQNFVTAQAPRVDLQAPLTQEQMIAHQLLLHIRQAVQTALFVANKKSSFNIGYLLPTTVTSYLDKIVGELTKYDTYLDALCKDPQFGATVNDTYQSEQRWMITKYAAGAVTAAAVTAIGLPYVTAATMATISGIASAGKTASEIASAWSKPDEGSTLARAQNIGSTVLYGADKVGKAAGAVVGVAGAAQYAISQGYVPQELLSQDTVKLLNKVENTAKNVATVGGFVNSVKSVSGLAQGSLKSWQDIVTEGKNIGFTWALPVALWNTGGATINAINNSKFAVSQAHKLYKDSTTAVAAGKFAYQNLRELAGLETTQEYRHPEATAEQISQVFTQVIITAIQQNQIPTQQVQLAAQNLLQNNAPPMHVIQGLQIVQKQAPDEQSFIQIQQTIDKIARIAKIMIQPVSRPQFNQVPSPMQSQPQFAIA